MKGTIKRDFTNNFCVILNLFLQPYNLLANATQKHLQSDICPSHPDPVHIQLINCYLQL